jgi:hypothetical protein
VTHRTRRSLVVALGASVLLVAGCASGAEVASPAVSASTPASASPAAASPSAPSSDRPSVVPSVAVATPSPVATPAPSTACAIPAQTGSLPSDRFTDIRVSPGATSDALVFVFGDPSLRASPVAPVGSLEVATPPYTQAGSGAPIQVNGDHVLQIRFTGMSLSNDVGQETYVGPRGIEEPFPALRHAVIYDMSEGVVGWYVGYDGDGCVALSQAGNEVTLTIQHP